MAGTAIAQGIWIEIIRIAIHVFMMVRLALEKHHATFIASVSIGLTLFVGELKDINAIEQAGGVETLHDVSAEGSLLDGDGATVLEWSLRGKFNACKPLTFTDIL